MTNLILFWHRRDLRLDDNLGLHQAQQNSQNVVGIFCFDPQLLQSKQVAPARIKYLLGCLKELQTRYQKAGSELLILHADPVTAIPELATTLNATAVFWNNDVEPYGRKRDRAVQSALETKGILVQTFWDQLLHAPGKILTQGEDPYKVYTPFWKNWQKQPKAQPLGAIEQLTGLSAQEQEKAAAVALPSLKDLGFTWDNELPLPPGETAAREKLEQFCDHAILDYDQNRNYPAVDGTSLLSAALKFGAIGIREVWQATETIWEDARSDEARENINAWRQELAWREFYQHALYFFPELADGPYRNQFKNLDRKSVV